MPRKTSMSLVDVPLTSPFSVSAIGSKLACAAGAKSAPASASAATKSAETSLDESRGVGRIVILLDGFVYYYALVTRCSSRAGTGSGAKALRPPLGRAVFHALGETGRFVRSCAGPGWRLPDPAGARVVVRGGTGAWP